MKVAGFIVADAANYADGSLNLLGGWRYVLKVPELPHTRQISILGLVEGMAEDLGTYPVSISFEGPKSKEVVVTDDVTLSARKAGEEGVPSASIFNATGQVSFATEGVYRVRLRIGRLRADHQFLVRLIPEKNKAAARVPSPEPAAIDR
jgi:hypothetical protein